MAVLIKNKTGTAFTMPFPMAGILDSGQGIVLSTTAAIVEAAIGESSSQTLSIEDVNQTGNFDDAEFLGELLTPGIDASELEDNAVTTPKIIALAVTTAKIDALAVTDAKLASSAVTGVKLAATVFVTELVAGQDETSDTTIPVTGLAAGDELVEVLVFTPAGPSFAQRALADFTIGAAEITVVANAADNTANQYHIRWIDKT